MCTSLFQPPISESFFQAPQDLLQRSDLVVVGTAVSTAVVGTNSLPDKPDSPYVRLRTRFRVRLVLKGDVNLSDIVVSYCDQVLEPITSQNVVALATGFELQLKAPPQAEILRSWGEQVDTPPDPPDYLLFLTRTQDGILAPTTGELYSIFSTAIVNGL